jgi:hypothetical protein
MPFFSLRTAVFHLLVVATSVPCVAHAQDADAIGRAKTLFDDGKRLLEQRQYEKACPLLAESFRLTAATGPLLALAVCHEGQNKTATAWSEYNEVVARVRLHGQADWADKAAQAAAALEPKLSRLTIALEAGTGPIAGLVVKRDGRVLGADSLGLALPVDPGVHAVEANAPNRQPWSTQVVAADGASLSVTVPQLQRERGSTPEGAQGETAASRRPVLRTVGIGIGVAGIVALGVGGYFGVRAISKNNDSKPGCDGNACDPDAKQARLDAISAAQVATVAFIAGGALLAGGVALFVLGKPEASRPAMAAMAIGDGRMAGIMLRGSF